MVEVEFTKIKVRVSNAGTIKVQRRLHCEDW